MEIESQLNTIIGGAPIDPESNLGIFFTELGITELTGQEGPTRLFADKLKNQIYNIKRELEKSNNKYNDRIFVESPFGQSILNALNSTNCIKQDISRIWTSLKKFVYDLFIPDANKRKLDNTTETYSFIRKYLNDFIYKINICSKEQDQVKSLVANNAQENTEQISEKPNTSNPISDITQKVINQLTTNATQNVDKKRQEEQKRLDEEAERVKLAAEEEQKRLDEERVRLEEERIRLEEERVRIEEEEKQKLDEQEKQKLEEEKQKLEEEKRKLEEEETRQKMAEEEARQKMAELEAQRLAAEEQKKLEDEQKILDEQKKLENTKIEISFKLLSNKVDQSTESTSLQHLYVSKINVTVSDIAVDDTNDAIPLDNTEQSIQNINDFITTKYNNVSSQDEINNLLNLYNNECTSESNPSTISYNNSVDVLYAIIIKNNELFIKLNKIEYKEEDGSLDSYLVCKNNEIPINITTNLDDNLSNKMNQLYDKSSQTDIQNQSDNQDQSENQDGGKRKTKRRQLKKSKKSTTKKSKKQQKTRKQQKSKKSTTKKSKKQQNRKTKSRR